MSPRGLPGHGMEFPEYPFVREVPQLALPIPACKHQHRRIHPETGAETGAQEMVHDTWVPRIQAPRVSGRMREALEEQAWSLHAQELLVWTELGAEEGEAQNVLVQAALVVLEPEPQVGHWAEDDA